jgi:hypothetical protein
MWKCAFTGYSLTARHSPLSVFCFTLSAHENKSAMSIKIPLQLKNKFIQNTDTMTEDIRRNFPILKDKN